MVTFTINIPESYIPYMDPMGWDISISHEEIVQYGKLEKNTRNSPEKKKQQLMESNTGNSIRKCAVFLT
jgi:hypothetical protein